MRIASIKSWLLVGAVLGGQFVFLAAQEPITAEGIPPESDYLYRQHYEQVQGIMKLPLGERETKLEGYAKQLHPKSKILQYMSGFFGEIVRAYQTAGDSAKADALASKIVVLFPDQNKPSEGELLQQAYQKKDYAKAIEIGEKMYAEEPNDQVAAILAQSYIETKNSSKAKEFSKIVIDRLGVQKSINFAVWLANQHVQEKDRATAVSYYNKILAAYPGNTPQGWTADSWGRILATAHSVKGADAYSGKRFDEAIREYTEALKYFPGNDQAYLFIGLSHWGKQELTEAMQSFAMAVAMGKGGAPKAREYLEQIYKPLNEDSLDGLEDLIGKAREALN